MTKREVKTSKFSFCVFYGLRRSRGPSKCKKTTKPISSYLDRTSLDNKGFLTWHSTPSCFFVFLLLWLPVSTSFFSLLSFSLTLLVFAFSSSIRIEKSRKIFLLSRKIFLERKLSCTYLDFGEILLREQNGQSRAESIAPSYSLWQPITARNLVHLVCSRS